MTTKEIGDIYEKKARDLLLAHRYQILETNYRTRVGEIDIIAKKNGTIVFVEVKFRSNLKFGYGVEAVDLKKIRKIYKSAKIYLIKNKMLSCEVRFDCISFLGERISWIKNLAWGDEVGF